MISPYSSYNNLCMYCLINNPEIWILLYALNISHRLFALMTYAKEIAYKLFLGMYNVSTHLQHVRE